MFIMILLLYVLLALALYPLTDHSRFSTQDMKTRTFRLQSGNTRAVFES
jgi:hypothetical protein